PAAASSAAPPAPLTLPPLRRMLGMALPGVAALALWAHMVFTPRYNNGTPQYPGLRYWVWAAWGELGTAGVLAMVAALAFAGVFATMLGGQRPRDPAQTGPVVLATLTGLAVCGLLGLLTTAIFNVRSPGQPLRWALLPAVPIAVTALVLALLAHRRSRPPEGGWDAFFAFPLSALILLAVGTPLVAHWYTRAVPSWFVPLGQTGAAMIGAGLACVLFRRVVPRAATAVFLAAVAVVITNPNTLGVLVAVAVTARVAYQIRMLYAAPAAPHPDVGPTVPARQP
ncbi:hypothetical protein AB0M20_39045, partial [Actinoplanes sp. NPDC051633]